MEEAANIYYDVQGTRTPAMKFERSNLLVPDDEYKKLTTYMPSCMNITWLKQQRQRTLVLRLLSSRYMFFIILKKRSSMSSGSACFSYTRNALSIHKC